MMCTLSVLSKGYLIKDLPTIGQVHSVFQRAVNIIFGNQLITILNKSYANFPTALRVNTDTICWQNLLMPNQIINWNKHSIQTKKLMIAINDNTSNWNPKLLTYPINIALSHNLINQLELLLTQYRFATKYTDNLLQLLSDKQYWRTKLLLTNDQDILTEKVEKLIGFGAGLTPDGDDFLVGYLAAFWLVTDINQDQTDLLQEQHIQVLCQIIKSRLSCTNTISAHHLNLALNKHFSEPIHNLLNACCDAALLAPLKSTTHALVNYGASSGLSCLAGIIQGLKNRYSQISIRNNIYAN